MPDNKEVTGVTSFVAEACSHAEALGKYYVPSRVLHQQQDLQDLKKYFARPRLISQGSLNTSSRGVQIIENVNLLSLLNVEFPHAKERLMGIYGLRFSLVYSLQVAATPFHQGLLYMSWQYGVVGSTPLVFLRGMRPETATNLPHVKLDLASETMAQFKAPFLHVHEFMPITSTHDYGLLTIGHLLPTPVVSGLVAPTFKLYLHLEDLEFIGASPAETTTVTLQGGLSPIEKESKSQGHIISKTLATMSNVAAVASRIPMLSAYAGPTSWFLRASSLAANAFGYSKPQIEDPINRVIPTDMALEQNVDTASPSMVLAPFVSNRLRVDPTFAATDVDEMSLAYVLQQYTQVCYGSMTAANSHSAVLYGARVSPSCMWFRAPLIAPFGNMENPNVASSSSNSFQPSGLFYWASMFRLWRGGLTFRFTFSKTKHHGGRIMVCYNPGSTYVYGGVVVGTTTGPEVNGTMMQPFGYTSVFDLRDNNVFEFEVPYIAETPYTSFTGATGGITMSVMDPLQAPSVVSNTVNFLVEVKCNSDFELAVPSGIQYPAHPRGTVKYQSGTLDDSFESDVCELTIGERVNSAKQLIMLPKWNYGALNPNIGSTVLCYPWYTHNQPVTTVPPADTDAHIEMFSYGGNIATCYAYVRGATEFHVYPNRMEGTMLEAYCLSPDLGWYFGPSDKQPQYKGGSGQSRVVANNGKPLHFKAPAYQNTIRVPSHVYNDKQWQCMFGAATRNANPVPTADGINYHYAFPAMRAFNNVGLTYYKIARAAADDAMLGHYMGPTPMLVPAVTATVVWDPDILANAQ